MYENPFYNVIVQTLENIALDHRGYQSMACCCTDAPAPSYNLPKARPHRLSRLSCVTLLYLPDFPDGKSTPSRQREPDPQNRGSFESSLWYHDPG